jgi:CMP-N,N'-diacetyllegionaminic acid synthase
MNGLPLLAYTVRCALACPAIGHVVISTDDDEIAAVAEAHGIRVPFRRPADLASNTAGKAGAIRHATEYVEQHEGFLPDIVVDLDISVPLRKPMDITACVGMLADCPDLDAVVTMYEAERNPYYTMVEAVGDRVQLVKQLAEGVTRRQDAPVVYGLSGSVFAFRRSRLMSVAHLHQGKWGGCIIPRERAIEADTELDWAFVEFLMSRDA